LSGFQEKVYKEGAHKRKRRKRKSGGPREGGQEKKFESGLDSGEGESTWAAP